jgi:hypothetical protein
VAGEHSSRCLLVLVEAEHPTHVSSMRQRAIRQRRALPDDACAVAVASLGLPAPAPVPPVRQGAMTRSVRRSAAAA